MSQSTGMSGQTQQCCQELGAIWFPPGYPEVSAKWERVQPSSLLDLAWELQLQAVFAGYAGSEYRAVLQTQNTCCPGPEFVPPISRVRSTLEVRETAQRGWASVHIYQVEDLEFDSREQPPKQCTRNSLSASPAVTPYPNFENTQIKVMHSGWPTEAL